MSGTARQPEFWPIPTNLGILLMNLDGRAPDLCPLQHSPIALPPPH